MVTTPDEAGFTLDLATRNLVASTRRRAQDELLTIVSHDLRGPLNAIGLACEALSGELSADEHRRCVDAIGRSSARCERLIKDLLAVAHLERGGLSLQAVPFDIRVLARHVCHDHEGAVADAGSTLDVSIPEQPAWIIGDRNRLQQVLANLIGNALVHARGAAIGVSVVVRGDEIVITVADDGPGIAPDVLPLVFERYRAGSRHHGGAGLGLAIVKGVVEAHRGTAVVTSRPGDGARFEVVLPRGEAPPSVGA